MSSELSVSETTPLRRPDLNEELATSTPTHSVQSAIQSGTNGAILKTHITTNHNNNNHIDPDLRIRMQSGGIVVGGASAVAAAAGAGAAGDHQFKMETNKRILCRIGTDILILMCVGFPILLFFLLGEPYKRGFFCDDESLKHPFHDSTVRNWMLYIIGLVIPVGIVFSVEIFKAKSSKGSNNRRFVFNGVEIPDWLIECYKKIGVFGFGAALSQLTTDIAKYSIGRLRPHFFAVCQPIMPDGSDCSSPLNAGRYIVDFQCLGVNSTERMLKEVRLSFPSGHSSFSFYTMVYMALYLQARMSWKGSKLLKHFLQFLLIMIAWYTALSRVSDYKHHWSDVLAGVAIGTIAALAVAYGVSDLFEKRQEKSYLPSTRQDLNMPPQTITNGHS